MFYIMGNTTTNNSEKYHNSQYTTLNDNEIKHIRTNYKVIDVDWLDTVLTNNKMFDDDYFIKLPQKKYLLLLKLQIYKQEKL